VVGKLVFNKSRIILGLLILSCILHVSAFPQIPETYEGFVYIDGVPAKVGDEIKVVSESNVEFTAEVIDSKGYYVIDILFDDTETANVKEGVAVNEPLTWYVNGRKASKPAEGSDVATSGGINDGFDVIVGSGKASCSDGVRNNGESGVDCGGPCDPCKKTKAETTVQSKTTPKIDPVQEGSATTSLEATPTASDDSKVSSETPKPASCSDGVRNNDEVGVDCGGSCDSCDEVGDNKLLWIVGFGIILLLFFSVALLVILFILLKTRKKSGQ